MRTLEEVIDALEICSQMDAECEKCPYKSTAKGWCEEKDRDALHYLKEYQKILPLVPSLINTAIAVQKKGKTIG